MIHICSCRPFAVTDFQLRLSACVDDVAAWMLANRLQLNTGKTDLLWCATSRHRHQLPNSALSIGSDLVKPSYSVRVLGIYFDADLRMRCHVQKQLPAASPFYASCAVPTRRSVPRSVYHMLVVALVLSQLDYGNAVLVGLPAYLYNRLQSVLNAAARSIAGLRRSDHITDTLASFHWLKVTERIQFKLATIVNRSLNGTAPHYLTQTCAVFLICRPDDVCDHHSLTSSMSTSRRAQQLESWRPCFCCSRCSTKEQSAT